MFALVANLVVAVVGTVVLRALRVPDGEDETQPEDFVDPAPEAAAALPATPEQEQRAGRFGRPVPANRGRQG